MATKFLDDPALCEQIAEKIGDGKVSMAALQVLLCGGSNELISAGISHPFTWLSGRITQFHNFCLFGTGDAAGVIVQIKQALHADDLIIPRSALGGVKVVGLLVGFSTAT